MFGADRRVILHLLDVEACAVKLEALVMELEDLACASVRVGFSSG